MRTHRWWLALVAALLTPWIGPHVGSYIPLGWILVKASDNSPEIAFWIIAAVLLSVAYLVWLGILTGVAALLARRKH